jgi:hypothetical protein
VHLEFDNRVGLDVEERSQFPTNANSAHRSCSYTRPVGQESGAPAGATDGAISKVTTKSACSVTEASDRVEEFVMPAASIGPSFALRGGRAVAPTFGFEVRRSIRLSEERPYGAWSRCESEGSDALQRPPFERSIGKPESFQRAAKPSQRHARGVAWTYGRRL